MQILLDTHLWLWSFGDMRRIGRGLAAALGNPDNELWISPVSIWEAMMLLQEGSMEMSIEPDIWIRRTLATGFVSEAPLTHEVAIHSRLIDLPHKDPADRFIAATALVNGFTLATADKRLLACRAIRTIPNR